MLSGCARGMVMVTSMMTGVVLRRISDHSGAPITGIDVRQELVQVRAAMGDVFNIIMNSQGHKNIFKCVYVCVCMAWSAK